MAKLVRVLDKEGNSYDTEEVANISRSILGRKEFVTPDGSGRMCPDDRDRVWKVWSRIVDNIVTKEGGRGSLGGKFATIQYAMKRARHFVLPKEADNWNTKSFYAALRPNGDGEWLEMLRGMFHTFVPPFPVCALHLPGEAIAILLRLRTHDDEMKQLESGLFALKDDIPISNSLSVEEEDRAGSHGFWGVITFHPNQAPLARDLSTKWPLFADRLKYASEGDHSHSTCCLGVVRVPEDSLEKSIESDSIIPFSVAPLGRWDCMKNGMVLSMSTGARGFAFDCSSDTVGEGAQLGFDLLHAIQSHKRFIVEMKPAAKKKKKKKAKRKSSIASIAEQSVYLSLEPQAIRETLGIPKPESNNGKRAPHERRAHLRELRSERFTWKRGEKVPVKGSWIGPTSGTTNEGREYRVLLTKISPHVSGQ